MSAQPEGLDRCSPRLVREALALADARGLTPPVAHLRAVDGGRAIVVVNAPQMRAPGVTR